MATDAQLAANRANALKSTGPQTADGTSRSRLNALKHGLHSASHTTLLEDSESYDSLFADLQKTFDPQDIFEDRLVESIASAIWRRDRALRAEARAVDAEIESAESSRISLRRARLEELTTAFSKLTSPYAIVHRTLEGRRGLADLLTFSLGCDWFLDRLSGFAAKLSEGCPPAPRLLSRLAETCAFDDSDLGRVALDWAERRYENNSFVPSDGGWSSIHQRLRGRIAEIEALRDRLVEAEQAQDQRYRDSISLPCATALNPILRYERAIANQLYRDLAELERRRARRQDDSVPATIHLEISPQS